VVKGLASRTLVSVCLLGRNLNTTFKKFVSILTSFFIPLVFPKETKVEF
jgi:hypothetical protein